MDDESLRTPAIEGEAPVNPYSLLGAVNEFSETAHTAWLIFLGLMSYLVIAVAGVTHKDLLLSSDIQLPVLQVRIDLVRFFLFAPIVLALFHLGVLTQVVLLARKALELDGAVRMLEVSDRRTHPLRLELDNFFYTQALAGPDRSPVMSTFLTAMAWFTLILLPVAVLLFIQVAFLPYHDVATTWMHRATLAFDIAVLVLMGIFLTRAESSFLRAFWLSGLKHPFSFAATSVLLALVAGFSALVATVPGERLDRISRALLGRVHAVPGAEASTAGFVLPFVGVRADGTLLGFFRRNLNVPDLDLVVDKDVTPGETTLTFRGRDLRYARLDRTDLHQADFTGADLTGASLVGADLRGVLLQCADLGQLILTENRKLARCVTARGVNLTRARLSEARLAGVDLAEARLDEADLDGADLSYAGLAGVSLYNARLERADLTGGVGLEGANLATATLQGADLTGARLIGADLTSAALQGAVLVHADLRGATLRNADLEGADLTRALLQGADLKAARLRAASLREAAVWQTVPPDRDQTTLADVADLAIAPVSEVDAVSLSRRLGALEDETLRGRVSESVAALTTREARGGWQGPAGGQEAWQQIVQAAQGAMDGYAPRVTDHLARLACKPRWSSGGLATGLVRQALRPEFRGTAAALYEKLRADDCPASKTIPPKTLKALATAVDVARGD